MDGERNRPAARVEVIDAAAAGQRIDNWLLSRLKGVPKSRVYRLLRTGQVRVNGGRIKAPYRLRAGDRVRIPPVRTAVEGETPAIPEGVIARLREAVLHDADDLLVIDKPSGIAVHGGSGLAWGVIEALKSREPGFLELVHRLDRETSGCLLLARSREALLATQRAFQQGEVEKSYLLLVRSEWPEGRMRVDAPLRRDLQRGGERVVEVRQDGREALTEFEAVERYRGATLVRAVLHTGRTHQIRVHAAHLGHPLAGDERYGDRAFNRQMRELGLRRLFLHASSLVLPVPGRDERLTVSSPLPEELQDVLNRLENR